MMQRASDARIATPDGSRQRRRVRRVRRSVGDDRRGARASTADSACSSRRRTDDGASMSDTRRSVLHSLKLPVARRVRPADVARSDSPTAGQYRIEIPSCEGPKAMQAVVDEAAARHDRDPSHQPGQRHHAADRRRDPRDARARPASTASRCVCSSGRARTGTRACRRRRPAAACSGRRCAARISSRFGIDDVLHGASLGLRSILVADLGQLQMFGDMKKPAICRRTSC